MTMSNSIPSAKMAERSDETKVPRAIVHKQILDAAEARPEASMEAIADEVTGASLSIVDRVLEEYGDPAETDADGDDTDGESDGMTDETDDESDGATDDTAAESDATPDERDAVPDHTTESVTADLASDFTTDSVSIAEPGTEIDAEPSDPAVATGVSTESDTEPPSESDSAATEPAAADDLEDRTTDAPAVVTEPESRHSAPLESTTTDDSQVDPPLEPSDLTEKQRETLHEIRERPDATQAELADRLGVTAATINQRVNAIEGFDWSGRREFVDALFASEPAAESDTSGDAVQSRRESDVRCEGADNGDDEAESGTDGVEFENRSGCGETESVETEDGTVTPSDAATVDGSSRTVPQSVGGHPDRTRPDGSSEDETRGERRERVDPSPAAAAAALEEVNDQLAALTRTLEAVTDRVSNCRASRAQSSVDPDFDPELAHKLLRACLTADDISAEEELRIVRAVLFDDAKPE